MTLAVAYLLLEALRDAVKQYGGGERQGLEALEKYMTGVFGESWGTECAAGIDMVLKVLQASGELDFGNRRVDGGLDDTVKTGPALETSVWTDRREYRQKAGIPFDPWEEKHIRQPWRCPGDRQGRKQRICGKTVVLNIAYDHILSAASIAQAEQNEHPGGPRPQKGGEGVDVSTIIAAVIGGVVGWHLGDIVFGVKGKGSVKGAPKEDKAEKGQNEAQDFHESEPNGMQ